MGGSYGCLLFATKADLSAMVLRRHKADNVLRLADGNRIRGQR